MAGFGEMKKRDLKVTQEIELVGSSGVSPQFVAVHKDGRIEDLLGDFAEQKVTLKEATHGERLTVNGYVPLTVIPPACPKGAELKRCKITIRNPLAPDSIAFREKYGYDAVAQLDSNNPKYNAELTGTDISIITAASVICGFENLPKDGDDKAFLQFTPENAYALMQDLEPAVLQIEAFLEDRKKFESRSPTR